MTGENTWFCDPQASRFQEKLLHYVRLLICMKNTLYYRWYFYDCRMTTCSVRCQSPKNGENQQREDEYPLPGTQPEEKK